MKNFMIAGSSLVAVAAAGSAGAVDVTLGGSIGLEVEYGTKKTGGIAFGDTTMGISLSLEAAGTTDGGIKYGGSFDLKTVDELKFSYFANSGGKYKTKVTVKNYTDLQAAAYNVSGGMKLDADDIVAVKINSEWKSVSANTRTAYLGSLQPVTSTNVCKLAGKIQAVQSANHTVERATALGKYLASKATIGTANNYMAAGQLADLGAGAAGAALGLIPTANTSAGTNPIAVNLYAAAGAAPAATAGGKQPLDNDKFNLGLKDGGGAGAAAAAPAPGVPGIFQQTDDVVVQNAAVYVGPFMEVKMQSSTTKMVVGAVCVTGKSTSDTVYYLDNADSVVTASNAKIFVDGGFGKLTIQTSDYAGKVAKIGDAGDAANISADGLVAILEADMAGVSMHAAADLNGKLGDVEAIIGGSINLGGISVAADVETSKVTVNQVVAAGAEAKTATVATTSWDLGASYAMGDGSVAFAMDSEGDMGLKAAVSVAGVGGSLTIYNKAEEAHKKYGMFYDAALSAAVNGATLSLSVNQDMELSGKIGYDIGGLNIYAGYDSADNGGKVGAKLSF